jgi:ankyrin repeat protein
MQTPYDGICPTNGGYTFTEHFVNLIKKDNCENIQLFLANLERNLFSNKLFRITGGYENALNYALKENFLESALCLVNTGNADVNKKSQTGYTPLMLCIRGDEEITIKIAEAILSNRDFQPEIVNNDGRTALIRCCRYRTKPSLKIGSALLDINRGNHQFILDSSSLSGLDYLLDFFDDEDETEFPEEIYCQMPEYVDFVVKYLKLYFDRMEKGDQVYERNIEKICRSKILYDTFGPALRRARTGINLYDVCKELKDAGKSVQSTGVVVSGLEVPEGLPEGLVEASEIPVVVAVEEPREGVSPGGRWVRPEDQRLYVRQHKRENPGPRGPGGSSAGGKKRKTINKRGLKRNQNKKSRRRNW